MAQYDAMAEEPGGLTAADGELLPVPDQIFTRTVTVVPYTAVIDELGGASVPGRRVQVQVTWAGGAPVTLVRFAAEPAAP